MVHPLFTLLFLASAASVFGRRHCKARTSNANAYGNPSRATSEAYLTPHNNERAQRGANALVWDDGLAASAQAWADQCKFQHSQTGENLYAATGDPTPANAVGAWNSESKDYNPGNPQYSHWTQVVWKATTKVGCAMKECPSGTVLGANYITRYYVCHYNPVGNVIGQFPENVQK
ncbi:unnamed protein product [Rhizoctonia solani]|uniref:SCP domain-containing protein n=1 Tax=Rhizoctonia solani TaxID=456999 RepID=A0A8H3AM61_9AGAM|nr:unnamed protein product [Rhizoctonia solani]